MEKELWLQGLRFDWSRWQLALGASHLAEMLFLLYNLLG